MNYKDKKYILPLLIGLFLVLVLTSSLFHNHPITLEEPSTCPVFLFQISLATAIISVLVSALLTLNKSEFTVFYNSSYIPKKIYFNNLSNRAPPTDLD